MTESWIENELMFWCANNSMDPKCRIWPSSFLVVPYTMRWHNSSMLRSVLLLAVMTASCKRTTSKVAIVVSSSARSTICCKILRTCICRLAMIRPNSDTATLSPTPNELPNRYFRCSLPERHFSALSANAWSSIFSPYACSRSSSLLRRTFFVLRSWITCTSSAPSWNAVVKAVIHCSTPAIFSRCSVIWLDVGMMQVACNLQQQ